MVAVWQKPSGFRKRIFCFSNWKIFWQSCVSVKMKKSASQILNCLMDVPVMAIEPGFVVESRTSYGIHGEMNDLALSVEWHDADGCLWAADFSEKALVTADLRKNTVALRDVCGDKLVFQFYQPAKHLL
jgi:hypothetical protein